MVEIVLLFLMSESMLDILTTLPPHACTLGWSMIGNFEGCHLPNWRWMRRLSLFLQRSVPLLSLDNYCQCARIYGSWSIWSPDSELQYGPFSYICSTPISIPACPAPIVFQCVYFWSLGNVFGQQHRYSVCGVHSFFFLSRLYLLSLYCFLWWVSPLSFHRSVFIPLYLSSPHPSPFQSFSTTVELH